jgi:esterase/lipase superfamily enzyme
MNASEIRSSIETIQSFVDHRKWDRLRHEPINVELVTFDVSQKLSADALVDILDYIEDHLGITLLIAGGGYSCVEIGLHSLEDDIPELACAIATDTVLGQKLNKARIDMIRLCSPEGLSSFAAYYEMQVGLCTNRVLQIAKISEDGLKDQFGNTLAENGELNFGIAEVLILDRSDDQSSANIFSRVWRKVFSPGDFLTADDKVHVSKINILDKLAFSRSVADAAVKRFMTSLHGVANTFDDSLVATVLLSHRAQLRKLELFPLLFSWPSKGEITHYLPDTNTGEKSEEALATYLECIDGNCTGRAHSVIAYSHGGKILVRAFDQLSVRQSRMSPITRVLFVASDIDGTYFVEKASVVARWTKSQVVYYSKKDKALFISGLMFDSKRLGKNGVSKTDVSKLNSMDVIDVTGVSGGLAHHAPHVESTEVLDDIHQCLMGVAAKERLRLEPERGQQNYWRVR